MKRKYGLLAQTLVLLTLLGVVGYAGNNERNDIFEIFFELERLFSDVPPRKLHSQLSSQLQKKLVEEKDSIFVSGTVFQLKSNSNATFTVAKGTTTKTVIFLNESTTSQWGRDFFENFIAETERRFGETLQEAKIEINDSEGKIKYKFPGKSYVCEVRDSRVRMFVIHD